MAYRDLRDWLQIVDGFGEIKRIPGVNPRLEMGGLVDVVYRDTQRAGRMPPLMFFEDVPGYGKEWRVLYGLVGSIRRLALTLQLPLEYERLMDFVLAYRQKSLDVKLIPPRTAKETPVTERVYREGEVDFTRFPTPFHHELDGGLYLGTGHVVITRDPDTGWVNCGTYRCKLQSKDVLGLYISPGKQGGIHKDKFAARKQPCPVAVVIGADPALWLASGMEVPMGVCEYDYAGGWKGEALEVFEGPCTGLPLPARAEIVIEGEIPPDVKMEEGPFGEWPGYYCSKASSEPVIKVKSVMMRRDPILTCSPPSRPPDETSFYRSLVRSALLWEELEKTGVPDIKGVWCHEAGGSRLFTVVSIRQRYPGHARQAALLASQVRSGAYLGRFVAVVDDDIDPSDTYDVLWAISTRCEPENDIDILRRTWSSKIDPLIRKPTNSFHNSRAILDACRPYEWREEFPPVCESSPDLRSRLQEKFKEYLGDL